MTRINEQASPTFPTRGFRVAVLAFALALAGRGFASEAIKSYATLTLKDGRTFSAVEIVNYTANGVLVRHAGGATTFRFEILPDDVIASLHLKGWQNEPGFAALADKPAVADANGETADLALADRPAVTESASQVATDRPSAEAAPAADLANAPAVSEPTIPAPVTAVALAEAKSSVAGEGNLPDLEVSSPFAPAPAVTASAVVTQTGRVVITLPQGTFFINDADVRAYPADLLPAYVVDARNKARQAAQNLREQAATAGREGRMGDFEMLTARANRTAARFVDYLPAPAAATRSDEFGNFTVQHTLASVRIVAAGQLTVGKARVNYEWIGVPAAEEIALTEANATTVVADDAGVLKYAAR